MTLILRLMPATEGRGHVERIARTVWRLSLTVLELSMRQRQLVGAA